MLASSTSGSGAILGIEDDCENQAIIDGLIKSQMNDTCSLNLIPTNKMAQMIERYVSSNETHGLETFVDHEIFRKSYHEIRRSIIE